MVFGGGFGSITVGANGYAALSGYLPDDTVVAAPAASVAVDGEWPFYAPLYGKSGALFGWLYFADESATNISGSLIWARTNSFTNTLAADATPLASPPFLGLTNFQIVLSGGDLPTPLTNALTLLKSGVMTAGGYDNSGTGSFNRVDEWTGERTFLEPGHATRRSKSKELFFRLP